MSRCSNLIRSAACAATLFATTTGAMAALNDVGVHQGNVLVRLRGLSIQPNIGRSDAMSALDVNVNNSIVPELDFTYMIRDSIGVELILATSRHNLTSNSGNLGSVDVLPPTLLLQYHFNHQGKVRPYVGGGVNYTYFYKNDLQVGGVPVQVKRSSVGPALQIGIDIDIAKNVFFNADLKKIWMRTSVSQGGTALGSLKIDPVVLGIGIGVKF